MSAPAYQVSTSARDGLGFIAYGGAETVELIKLDWQTGKVTERKTVPTKEIFRAPYDALVTTSEAPGVFYRITGGPFAGWLARDTYVPTKGDPTPTMAILPAAGHVTPVDGKEVTAVKIKMVEWTAETGPRHAEIVDRKPLTSIVAYVATVHVPGIKGNPFYRLGGSLSGYLVSASAVTPIEGGLACILADILEAFEAGVDAKTERVVDKISVMIDGA